MCHAHQLDEGFGWGDLIYERGPIKRVAKYQRNTWRQFIRRFLSRQCPDFMSLGRKQRNQSPSNVARATGNKDFHAELFGRIRPFEFQIDGVKPLARRDEQGLMILATKADVGCPRFRNSNMFDLLSIGRKNNHAFARQINVSLLIQCHSVRAEFASERFIRQTAVGVDVVSPGLVCSNVGNKKSRPVGRADDAVGLEQIRSHAPERFAIGREKVNLLCALWRFVIIPPRALVKWVGKEK